MKYEETLEVISINPAYDAVAGKTLFQIIFGKYGKIKNAIPGQLTGMDAAGNQMILFIPKKAECQYKVGSKWHITVNDDGLVSLVKAREEEK